jgi:predicted DNA-binding transcriptional regulator AlpA
MSNSQRPIIRLKPKQHPFSPVDLQTHAARLATAQESLKIQAPAHSAGVRPLKQTPSPDLPTIKARPSRHERRHGPGVVDLSQPGFLRLEQVLAIYPVSRASWYAGLGTIYPNSVRIGLRSVAWRTEDIRRLVNCLPDFGNA